MLRWRCCCDAPAPRSTPGGRALLDLQAKARAEGRPTDELIVLYVLEAFLRRLAGSPYKDLFVLKGGVLLAAFGDRRPTRDVDFQARRLHNDAESVTATIRAVAALPIDDGVVFDTDGAVSEVIREDDGYQGVRVRMDANVDRARPRFAVNVSVGDPIEPAPRTVLVPALLGGPPVEVLGYPLPMVLAEKVVTALQRGTANTRWRDFADLWTLSRNRDGDGTGAPGVAGRGRGAPRDPARAARAGTRRLCGACPGEVGAVAGAAAPESGPARGVRGPPARPRRIHRRPADRGGRRAHVARGRQRLVLSHAAGRDFRGPDVRAAWRLPRRSRGPSTPPGTVFRARRRTGRCRGRTSRARSPPCPDRSAGCRGAYASPR